MRHAVILAVAAAGLLAAGCSGNTTSSSSGSGSGGSTAGASGSSSASSGSGGGSAGTTSSSGSASSGSGSGSTGSGSSGSGGSSGSSGGVCVPVDGGSDFDAGLGICASDYGGSATFADGGSPGTISSLWGTGANQLVAVGGTGHVYTFDGSAWTTESISTTATLYGVWAASASDVWAVGSSGFVRHFDGTGWTSPPGDSTNIDLRAVSGASPDDVIMVGYTAGGASVALQWDGTRLRLMPAFPALSCPIAQGSNPDVRGVWTYDRNHAWAVGQCGYVAAWDGCAWSLVFTGHYDDFNSIHGTSPNHILIAGADADPGNGVLLQFDGASWNQILTGPSLRDVFTRGTDDVWAVGGDAPYATVVRGGQRADGGAFWRYIAVPNSASPLDAVWGQDDCTTWFAGSEVLTAP